MDSQYAQIPESSRTRWGLSILSVCVCCWQAVQQERNKTKQCLCNQTGFDCRFPQAPKLCILSSITSTRFFFFFASGRATGLPQLCGRLTMLPTREALQAGPAASEERRQNASRSGLRALQTGNRLTDGRTDSRRDAVKQSARVWYKLYSHQDSRRPSVCLYVHPSVCPPVACFRKPSPARLPTGLSPVPASRDISRFDPG